MHRRPPRPFPRPPAAPAVMPAALEAEFENLPFGGYAGELAAQTPAGPSMPPAQSFEIPPPDWEAEERERQEQGSGPQEVPPIELTAVESMMTRAVANGEIEDPPAPPGSPLPVEPLRRPEFPEPDWRAEEEQRERQKAAAAQDELEPPQAAYPARRRRKNWLERGNAA